MGPLIADTHAIVRLLTAPRKLGAAARRAFQAADEGRTLCCVPTIVPGEIELLKERGEVGVSAKDVLRVLSGRPGDAVVALDTDQALELAGLVGLKDPMDRLLVAATRATGLRVVSVDDALDGFGVERVWE